MLSKKRRISGNRMLLTEVTCLNAFNPQLLKHWARFVAKTTSLFCIITITVLVRCISFGVCWGYFERPFWIPKSYTKAVILQAPVVQRPDNFIRWIRHYSGSKIYFTLNVAQGFRAPPNLAVVRVCIFACTRGNTEIFAQIETVGL